MQPGTLVAGRYRIEAHLASGGMGAVYRARHTLAERPVALKILRPSSMGLDVADVRRFRREATASAHIGHPGIVEVLDAGVEEGFLFLVMELLEGESLRARRRHASRAELLSWIRALLDPLAAAHAKGFVHRDLKPENVFLARTSSGERLKLLDFGIARSIGGPSDTRTGTGLGTPGYMAPEQALEARGASPAADVWSVGVMLYETISGVRPFEGETPHATILRAVSEPHAPLTDVAPELAALVDACLAKRPADRPRDGSELARRFDALPPEALALDGMRLGPDELTTDADPTQAAQVASRVSERGSDGVDDLAMPRTRTDVSAQEPVRASVRAVTPPTRVSEATPRARVAPSRGVVWATGAAVLVGLAGLGIVGGLTGEPTAVSAPPATDHVGDVPPDADVARDAGTEEVIGSVHRVGERDVTWSLVLPAGWTQVDSPVPTVVASLRASAPVGTITPSANLVIERFDGDTRAFVELGLRNAAAVSTLHGQHATVLRGAPAVRTDATFGENERPYRARTWANVVDGVGVVLSCYADPARVREVAPACDALAASLAVELR